MAPPEILTSVLADPDRCPSLSLAEWDLLLRVARQEKVLGRLGYVLESAGVAEGVCPPSAWSRMLAARAYPQFLQVRAGRELRRILEAVRDLKTEIILLKGCAYLKAGLPVARGRAFADVDCLVRRVDCAQVEQALLAAGWEHQKLNAYDQRYYREWMHEIPPLRHRERSMEVDIHHTILPLTSRLSPDPELLWKASIPLSEPPLRVLAPADMILHSATHLLYDGEVKGGFKDLLDLHQLLTHFGGQDDFWESLPERAALLDLERPLFYGVSLCWDLFRTPIPEHVMDAARRAAPSPFGGRGTLRLMRRVLLPRHPEGSGTPVSDWLLFVRSHWLRMPPWLLAKHLARKMLTRFSGGRTEVG